MIGNTTLLGRLLRLITMIQGDRHWHAASIAEHLGVGERTVYRDLKRLEAGVWGEVLFVPCRATIRSRRARFDFALTDRLGIRSAVPLGLPKTLYT